MLRQLLISNFAIIESLELNFAEGMSVLTGETGAGKSILLGALGLTLGDRADSTVLRQDKQRAEVTADFDIAGLKAVKQWLQAHDLDADGECIIRRIIGNDGRSRAYINGQPQPLQLLKELGEHLVDIHGQHAHQSLLKRDIQRQLLDEFAHNTDLLSDISKAYKHWKKLHGERGQLHLDNQQRESRLELISYQVTELKDLDLNEAELTQLDEEHARLANASRLLESGENALQTLDGADGSTAVSQLNRSLTEIQAIAELDHKLTPVSELLDSAIIQAQEASTELRHYLSDLELDPQRLEWVEQRLADIQDQARKHHVKPDELPALLIQLEQEQSQLKSSRARLDTLDAEIAAVLTRYQELAKKLSNSRNKAITRLSAQVTANMQELGMNGGHFDIKVESLPLDEPTPYGQERLEFQVSANPGQALQAMAKVASGGELSRISLAIQVINAGQTAIPTLIFDEVDVGIGGGVAEKVGRQLRSLGSRCQVLCVTHQPQVAALGHNHFQISKQTREGSTFTEVVSLPEQERIKEVARMLGGVEMTDQTLLHAREMLELGQQQDKGKTRKRA
ncbi:MAG: DNA repair protein RecN [Gammaproteobacteria bacterium]|nr:DNA repair protein RecN [Gammaproteobacteria bacterium]